MRNAGKVTTGFSMSLDGFVAGPNEDFQHLFAWMTSGDTDYTLTIGKKEQKLKIAAESVERLDDAINTTGALVAGRRLYELTHGWGGHHPVGAPVVVVTHRPAPEWVKEEWPVTFVTDGVESALEQAKVIAGVKKVVVASATIAQQCLNAGLLDEIHIDLVPFLLGDGVRLFEHLKGTPVALENPQVSIGKGVTHLTYRIKKEASEHAADCIHRMPEQIRLQSDGEKEKDMSTVIAQNTVTSKDGTVIAYSQVGQGPALILVDGALCYREFGPSKALAAMLSPHFTVATYDRRGRGESGDTLPYAVEREVEDLEALIEAVGGTAFVAGQSSGSALVIEAANRLSGITKLALYEAPFVVDDTGKQVTQAFLARLKELVVENRRTEAVKLFMKQVGTPGFMVAIMPLMPMWSKLKAVAHTLPYDISTVVDYGAGQPLPRTLGASITAPTLVMDGGKSPTWMRHSMQALAQTLPNANYRTLAGQTHMVKAEALAPVLVEFFTA